MLKKLWRPETGIFLAAWLLLLAGGQSRLFRDPGTFWHTVVGERILTTGEFLDHDPFSYTFANTPWTPYEWLAEVGMALLHRLGGWDTLLLATATILAAVYTWLAHRLIRSGLHWSLAVVALVLVVGASASHFHVRPLVLTIAFLGVNYAGLSAYEAGRLPLRRLFWLVPLYVVWTNTHGGMLGGLATMGLALVGWTAFRLLGWPSPLRDVRQLAGFAGLVAACGLTALVNPYGVSLPWTWYTIMQAPLLPQIIVEHAPAEPLKPYGMMIVAFGVVYLFVLAGVWPKKPRVTWLLPLVWFALTWTRVRHAPLFAVTAGVALADLFPQTRWAEWLANSGKDWYQPGPRPAWDWRAALLPAGAVLTALVLQVAHVPVPVVGAGWARLDPDYWPVDLAEDLKKNEGDGTPIFNEYTLGGFLIFHNPGYRVFVDDRCEVYGDRWLYDYVRAESDDTAGHMERWQREYGSFGLALTHTGSGFDRYFRQEGWTVVKCTPGGTLYRRPAPAADVQALNQTNGTPSP